MAISAFVFFAAIDPFLAAGSIVPFMVYRGVIVCGGLAILALTCTSFGKKQIALLSMASVIWTGASVVLLTELAGGASNFYWAMVMVTYFTCALVLPLKTRQALASFLVVASLIVNQTK